jgi:hypothetical protein
MTQPRVERGPPTDTFVGAPEGFPYWVGVRRALLGLVAESLRLDLCGGFLATS